MKKRRKADLSGIQQTIIELRDTERLSWGKIDTQMGFSKGVSATLYRRGKRVLAARAAEVRAWERNEGRRYTESQWWRLSRSLRKRWADRAPYPPEIMATLTKPKRTREDRKWDRDDNPLLTAEEKTEKGLATQSGETETPLPQPTIAPTASQRVPEPTQRASVAPIPVAAPAPLRGDFDASSVEIRQPSPVTTPAVRLVLDWHECAFDGSPIYRDRNGQPVEVVFGTGPRAKKLFLAGSNELTEVDVASLYLRNGFWIIRLPDGSEHDAVMENPDSYESEHAYSIFCATHWIDKRPRVSWLRILKIGALIDTSRLADDRALRNDQLAEQSRLQRQSREAVSFSEIVKQVDAQRQTEREAEKSQADLSLTPEQIEELYFKTFR